MLVTDVYLNVSQDWEWVLNVMNIHESFRPVLIWLQRSQY